MKLIRFSKPLNERMIIRHGCSNRSWTKLQTKELKYNDSVYIYLRPIDGGSFELSYSSLEELKKYCEQYSVNRDWWPDYIDLGGYNIPMKDVIDKNRLLKRSLLSLTAEQIKAVNWLEEICDVVRKGHMFYIH